MNKRIQVIARRAARRIAPKYGSEKFSDCGTTHFTVTTWNESSMMRAIAREIEAALPQLRRVAK